MPLKVGAVGRVDLDGRIGYFEMARRALHVGFAITIIDEVAGQVTGRSLLAHEYLFRGGKNVGRVAEDLSTEPFVNQMAEMDPIIGIDTRSGQKNAQGGP